VPFTAGSATDIIARTVMEQLSTQLGQVIVVENRVDAGGTLGIGAVVRGRAGRLHASSFTPRRLPSRRRPIPILAIVRQEIDISAALVKTASVHVN
jgi:tripartite-type tricarboxylate transporter receptor subunit TctC